MINMTITKMEKMWPLIGKLFDSCHMFAEDSTHSKCETTY